MLLLTTWAFSLILTIFLLSAPFLTLTQIHTNSVIFLNRKNVFIKKLTFHAIIMLITLLWRGCCVLKPFLFSKWYCCVLTVSKFIKMKITSSKHVLSSFRLTRKCCLEHLQNNLCYPRFANIWHNTLKPLEHSHLN